MRSNLVCDFNPRSYKRSDTGTASDPALVQDFNPRSYKRSDDNWMVANRKVYLISIHAPTRGATLLSTVLKLSERFQSTLLQEERREKI